MSLSRTIVMAALIVPPLAGAAQPAAPDPADARAAAPAVQYDSPFRSYLPFAAADEPTPDRGWRDANRDVGELGGHAGHMREQQRASAPPAPVSPSPSSGPPVRGGHGRHH